MKFSWYSIFKHFLNMGGLTSHSNTPIIIENWIEKLPTNLNYDLNKPWGIRNKSLIKKIIVHQELAEGDTESVHRYHIGTGNHIKSSGCPRICYHYTIEKDGTIKLCNKLTDIVWHCAGNNIDSIGIMLVGNFDGKSHIGKSSPTKKQLAQLRKLLTFLKKEYNVSNNNIFGHSDFGKENCPGIIVDSELKLYRGK